MAYNRLVGLEKGIRAFLGCFQVSAAGGFVYTRARVRASARLLFRKQNKVGSDTLTSLENKTRSVMFRKQNNGQAVNGQRVFLGRYLKSGKRSRAVLSMYTYTHARVGSVLSLSVFSYPKKLFFLFHSFFIYFFLLFLFSVKA